jgi:hypothetical protein
VAWLGAALLVLVAAWLFAPATTSPPLYDGIGFPDEPYRYVEQSPHGPHTPLPTAATTVVGRDPEGFLPVSAISAEQGPQIKIGMPAGALVASDSCAQVAVEADPYTPPQSAGNTWGNAYKVTLSCTAGASGPVQVTTATEEGNTSFIQLRAPDATQPGPTLAYSPDATTWRTLPTLRIGTDIYQAPMVGAGLYVLLHAPGGGPFGLDPVVLLLIGVLAALAPIILAIRMSRSRTIRTAADGAKAGREAYEGYVEGENGLVGRTGDDADPGEGTDPADHGPDQKPG